MALDFRFRGDDSHISVRETVEGRDSSSVTVKQYQWIHKKK